MKKKKKKIKPLSQPILEGGKLILLKSMEIQECHGKKWLNLMMLHHRKFDPYEQG